MIHVEQISKRYGAELALDRVSFDVRKGEILGFLGPNGAGKTTTMRILTGFVSPTSGRAVVAGYDVAEAPLLARQQLGYLPENVPLYPEMRVCEYLDFRARLRAIGRTARAARIAHVVDRTGLAEVRRKLIGALSKGFRQRVGLADALLANPPILILDEPTVGLDPNQIRDVRQLIRELGAEHTILLSTHILPEVEALASKVVIVHRGRVVAEDSPAHLRAQLEGRGHLLVELRGATEPVARELLLGLPGVRALAWQEGGRARVEVEVGHDVREALFHAVVKQGLVLTELHAEPMSLEDIFVEITTREEPLA
jgi:ABC-2 type transport system ATP-binding protein